MKTIDCGDCGESVPYGRLSCPACGSLLASVTGPRRSTASASHAVRAEQVSTAEAPSVAPEPILVATPEPTTTPEPVLADVAVAAVAAEVAEVAEVAEPILAVAEPAPVAMEPDPVPGRESISLLASAVSTGPFLLPDTDPRDLGWDPPEPEAPAIEAADEPATAPWSARPAPAPFLAPRPYDRRTVPEPASIAAAASSLPSAYRAPALSLALAGPSASDSALRASGLTSIGHSIGRAMGGDESPSKADDTGEAGGVDAERFVEIGGWFVVVGATMTVLGFVLPWSRSVIGAAGVGSYFDTWGLATPTNVLVFAGLLAVLGLGIVRTPVPAWIHSGALGLVSGSLVIGLAVPYLAGPLGADVGVMVVGLGGLALLIGGAVASWATRHAEADPPV